MKQKTEIEIVSVEPVAEIISLPAPPPEAANPALAYLISLGQPVSQVTLGGSLILAAWTLLGRDPSAVPPFKSPEGQEVLRTFPWGDIRAHHIHLLRNVLRAKDKRRTRSTDGYSERSFNKMLTALRQVSTYARIRKLMPLEACDEIFQIKPIGVDRLPAGKIISMQDVAKICGAAMRQHEVIAKRDLSMISMLMMGMRRAEVASAKLEMYSRITNSVRIIGKRNKEREVPVSDLLRDAFDQWIKELNVSTGPILRSVSKYGTIYGEGIVPQTVLDVVERLSIKAGIPRDMVPTPHDFRRTYITDMLDRGVDLLLVAKLAGHANVETTKIYDRRGEKAKQRAASVMDSAMREAGIEMLIKDGNK